MGKHISVTPLKFLMALLLWIFFLAYSCSNRVKSYIDSNQIVGCWHLEDESGALCYNQLTFYKDSTAIVDNKIDSCELLFDNFREKKHKMEYIRVKMDTKDLDSSFVKEFIPN